MRVCPLCNSQFKTPGLNDGNRVTPYFYGNVLLLLWVTFTVSTWQLLLCVPTTVSGATVITSLTVSVCNCGCLPRYYGQL